MKKLVIIGGGFGGLTATKELAKKDFNITAIDKTNITSSSPCFTRLQQQHSNLLILQSR